jgi:hypothetical protein
MGLLGMKTRMEKHAIKNMNTKISSLTVSLTLAPSAWTPVNTVPPDDGITKSVTVPVTNSASFYRLAQ